jgi:tetratricopeptide (TPR) repeat protein
LVISPSRLVLGGTWWWLRVALVVAGSLFFPATSRAADCAVSAYEPVSRARDAALVEAGELAATGRWADARAVYLWMLARRDEDAEALFGLARVDAWGGCWAIAESEYRQVLRAHPTDADVRAGYVDLLIWRGRLDEAERLVTQGLALDPQAPALLARAARFAYWRGDATEAVRRADAAERGAPDDGDLRAMRDRMFLGEARMTVHLDKYPPGYQDLFSVATQLLERTGRFEVFGGSQLVARYPNQASGMSKAVIDGRYPLGLAYHPALGATVGGEIAPGAPSNQIPVLSLKGWALTPMVDKLDAFVAYSFWYYSNGEIVHILNPALGVALPREFRLDVRGWIAAASLQSRSNFVGAGGVQLGWSATRRLDAGVTYTYGAEVDLSPTLTQLLSYRSHAATAFVDFLLGRRGGIRPLAGVAYRIDGDIVIWSLELTGYGRW